MAICCDFLPEETQYYYDRYRENDFIKTFDLIKPLILSEPKNGRATLMLQFCFEFSSNPSYVARILSMSLTYCKKTLFFQPNIIIVSTLISDTKFPHDLNKYDCIEPNLKQSLEKVLASQGIIKSCSLHLKPVWAATNWTLDNPILFQFTFDEIPHIAQKMDIIKCAGYCDETIRYFYAGQDLSLDYPPSKNNTWGRDLNALDPLDLLRQNNVFCAVSKEKYSSRLNHTYPLYMPLHLGSQEGIMLDFFNKITGHDYQSIHSRHNPCYLVPLVISEKPFLSSKQ